MEWVQRKSLLRKVRGLPGSEENNSVREEKNHHTVGRMEVPEKVCRAEFRRELA